MDNGSAQNILTNRFDTQIATPNNMTVQYDNMTITPPTTEIWSRVTMNFGEARQIGSGSNGNQRFRTMGVMIAQLFEPRKIGTKDVIDMADSVVTAFRAITITGLILKTPSVIKVGVSNNLWQVNVVCPFQFDDIG